MFTVGQFLRFAKTNTGSRLESLGRVAPVIDSVLVTQRMEYQDLVGYAAAAFVGLSLLCNSMISLRILACVSNGLFIHYGLMEQLEPVVVLHTVLLPINLLYLLKLVRSRRRNVDDGSKSEVAVAEPTVRNTQKPI